MKHVILGGTRSGKSRSAKQCALATAHQLHYITTAQSLDVEMTARVTLHRQQLNPLWQLIEEPLLLHKALQAAGCTRIWRSAANESPWSPPDCHTH